MSLIVQQQHTACVQIHRLSFQSALMSLPPSHASDCELSVAITCKMTSSTRSCAWEWIQTLEDIGRLCWVLQQGPRQTWTCLAAGTRRRPSDECQLSWNVPTEYTVQHHYQCLCPHLVYLGTFWVCHCKWQVKCQTAYLYILISNNDACYLPSDLMPVDTVLCWRLLFAFYLHENCTNKPGERILEPLDPMTNM